MVKFQLITLIHVDIKSIRSVLCLKTATAGVSRLPAAGQSEERRLLKREELKLDLVLSSSLSELNMFKDY